jgi:hypothetical protein
MVRSGTRSRLLFLIRHGSHECGSPVYRTIIDDSDIMGIRSASWRVGELASWQVGKLASRPFEVQQDGALAHHAELLMASLKKQVFSSDTVR